ncbi:hypothetical protein EMGBS6_04460 [Opitutia bacterium]|nr:hypothetical protein EMGBS6_04460 [Opitutae bacterium]
MHPDQLVNRPANATTLPLWSLAALPAAWFGGFALLTSHNPLTRAISLGSDLAKEQALKAIPQEWMGGLAQPVIQLINQYVGPYALIGEAFMTTWAVLLTLVLPAAFLLLGFGLVHGVLLLGGAPGGWKGTARAFLLNHLCADLATLAWAGLILTTLNTRYSILSISVWLLAGFLLIRLVAHTWLLAALIRAHSLGALRIILLGIPAYLFGLVIAGLIAFALWTWLIADLALVALR